MGREQRILDDDINAFRCHHYYDRVTMNVNQQNQIAEENAGPEEKEQVRTWTMVELKGALEDPTSAPIEWQNDAEVVKASTPCSSVATPSHSAPSHEPGTENPRKRKNDYEIKEIREKKLCKEEEVKSLEPFLFSRTDFIVSAELDYKVRAGPDVIANFYHPSRTTVGLSSDKEIMACILVGTGNIRESIINEGKAFFPSLTKKYIFASSNNIVCTGGNSSVWGPRFISYFDLCYDVADALCIPKNREALASAFSASTSMSIGADSMFHPAQFCQGICLVSTPQIQFEDFYVSYCNKEDTPAFEEDLITGMKLKAIVVFQCTDDRHIADLLQTHYNTELDIQDWDIDNLYMIGGNVEDPGTSACKSDMMACGWKIRANDDVGVSVLGLSGLESDNDYDWFIRRKAAVEKANIPDFFNGKQNGFVFMMYEEDPYPKETISIIHRCLPSHIPILGVQVTEGPLLFSGMQLGWKLGKAIPHPDPYCRFKRRDISLAFLMIAY